MRTSLLILAAALAPAAAAAEPAAPAATGPATPYTIGARVGGYGFRDPGNVDAIGHTSWNDCRMNGVGVFARRPLGRFFAEGGADIYFSETFPIPQSAEPGEVGMDRMSGLFTAAAGADLFQSKRFEGYAQLGLGLELTRVSMDFMGEHMVDQRALPLGFVGFGAELHLGRTSLGAMLRTHVMGHFDHTDPKMDVSPEIAAQGQFYLAYHL